MSDIPTELSENFFDMNEYVRGNRMMMAVAYRVALPHVNALIVQVVGNDKKHETEKGEIIKAAFHHLWKVREHTKYDDPLANIAAYVTLPAYHMALDYRDYGLTKQVKRPVHPDITEICAPLYELANEKLPEPLKKLFNDSYKEFKPLKIIAKEHNITVSEVRQRQGVLVQMMNHAGQ